MKALTNKTDEQIRENALRNYRDAPDHRLESVLRMNAGTVLREKEIVRQVARDLLEERRASESR